jgi:hypothetical protein
MREQREEKVAQIEVGAEKKPLGLESHGRRKAVKS